MSKAQTYDAAGRPLVNAHASALQRDAQLRAQQRWDARRERAARALDLTLDADGRGPRTFMARRAVATALDTAVPLRAGDVEWLEHVHANRMGCPSGRRCRRCR
jgi:hypothetical protein